MQTTDSVSATVIERREMARWREEAPALAALPRVDNAEAIVHMVNPVRFRRGRLRQEGLDRFWARLRRVAALSHIEGVLAPPVALRLSRPEGRRTVFLCTHLRSSKTKDELNDLLGERIFTGEGELGEEL